MRTTLIRVHALKAGIASATDIFSFGDAKIVMMCPRVAGV
jgi:hypothetical protein